MKSIGWYCLFAALLAIITFLVVWACQRGDAWIAGLTPVAIIFAAIIAYRQLKHTYHARRAGVLLDIMKWWDSNDMKESRQILWEMKDPKSEILKLYKAKDKNFMKVIKMADFGEALGVLISREYIDKKDLWLMFENDWKEWYQDFSGLLDELKKKNPLDNTFCNFKVLYEELEKIHR